MKPGEHQFVCVCCADLKDALATFLMADEKTTNALEDLGKKIEKVIEDGGQRYTPKVSDVCLAKFEGDQKNNARTYPNYCYLNFRCLV